MSYKMFVESFNEVILKGNCWRIAMRQNVDYSLWKPYDQCATVLIPSRNSIIFFFQKVQTAFDFHLKLLNMRWASIGVQKWIVLIGSNYNRMDESGRKSHDPLTIEFDVHREFSLLCVKVSKNTTNRWEVWKVVADVGDFQLETDGRWARGRPLLTLRRHNFTPWQTVKRWLKISLSLYAFHEISFLI